MSENNSAITKHWNEVLRLNQDEARFSEKSLIIYRALWVLAAFSFANVRVDFVWNLSDTLNGLMAVPNLIGLLLLAPMVFKVTRDYFEQEGRPLGRTSN